MRTTRLSSPLKRTNPVSNATPAKTIEAALKLAAGTANARVVISGSLYLAGQVLLKNGTYPD
jgi:dihydrofolate synthase/folylpolyglutamate synthase